MKVSKEYISFMVLKIAKERNISPTSIYTRFFFDSF